MQIYDRVKGYHLAFGEFDPTDGLKGQSFVVDWGDGTSTKVEFDLYVVWKKNRKERIYEAEVHSPIRVDGAARGEGYYDAWIIRITLQYFLETQPGVTKATVYEQTQDAVIEYNGELKDLIEALKRFHYEDVQLPDSVRSSSGRALNAEYKEKLIGHVAKRLFTKYMLPLPIRNVYTIWKAFHYVKEGVVCLSRGKLEVPVLDATAITVSILRRDCPTAGSVMFLLGLGEILEEWTHKKSVGDLARSMSLNVGKVWIKTRDQEILVDSASVVPGDHIIIHVGNVIPFDGIVADGEAMINQASMTGESEPVRKEKGGFVYAA